VRILFGSFYPIIINLGGPAAQKVGLSACKINEHVVEGVA